MKDFLKRCLKSSTFLVAIKLVPQEAANCLVVCQQEVEYVDQEVTCIVVWIRLEFLSNFVRPFGKFLPKVSDAKVRRWSKGD